LEVLNIELKTTGAQRMLMKTIRQRQLSCLGHVMRRHGLENSVVSGKRGGEGGEHQRLKCLHSLSTYWKDNVGLQEDKVLWNDNGRQRSVQ